MSVSLGELAVRFGCELRGDPDLRVERVATLAGAGPTALAFMVNPKYRPLLGETRAGAVVLGAADAAGVARTVLIAPNPYATYARIASVLHPAPAAPPGVHATAWIAPLAQIDVSAHVGPHASVGGGTRIGARAVIGPGCVIEGDVENGSLMAGQSVGMVSREQPTSEIITELVDQAVAALMARAGVMAPVPVG